MNFSIEKFNCNIFWRSKWTKKKLLEVKFLILSVEIFAFFDPFMRDDVAVNAILHLYRKIRYEMLMKNNLKIIVSPE